MPDIPIPLTIQAHFAAGLWYVTVDGHPLVQIVHSRLEAALANVPGALESALEFETPQPG